MNKMIMLTLSIVLIAAITVLLCLSQDNSTPLPTPNGSVTTPVDKPQDDNKNTDNDDNNNVDTAIQNVYISASGTSNPLNQAGYNTIENNVLQVCIKTSDALKLLNADRYSITVYLQGISSNMGGRYVLTSYDNELTTHNVDSSATWLYYVLPNDFALPQNGMNAVLTYYYYALVEIKDNTTNEVITSNLISGDIACKYMNDKYIMTVLDIELNSSKFTKSGKLPEVEQ